VDRSDWIDRRCRGISLVTTPATSPRSCGRRILCRRHERLGKTARPEAWTAWLGTLLVSRGILPRSHVSLASASLGHRVSQKVPERRTRPAPNRFCPARKRTCAGSVTAMARISSWRMLFAGNLVLQHTMAILQLIEEARELGMRQPRQAPRGGMSSGCVRFEGSRQRRPRSLRPSERA
jgi:hypothetical protein